MAECCDCGASFYRADDERWKARCIHCWRAKQAEKATAVPTHSEGVEAFLALRAEIGSNWRALAQLCHPDRHAQSDASVRVTQWLNGMRARLGL